MRISDWSSDVCSSDLRPPHRARPVRGAARAQVPAVPRLAAGVQTAAVGAVGDAARYRESMVADQRRDRTRMGDGRTAAPACAPPLRPALVAQSGAGDRQRAGVAVRAGARAEARSEEHTSELQSLMRISYAVFCLTK